MKKVSVKSEKGAVTLLVLVTILFFVMVLMSIYILVSNKTQAQIEMTRETRRIYGKETAKDIYSSFFGDNIIPIYTAEQFKEIGSNKNIPINEEGAKYYKFSAASTYVLMNDLAFENNGVFTLDFEGNGRLEGNGHEVRIKDTSKAQESYYYYNASNNYETAIIGD